jgi:hypothetical protein
MSGRTLDMTRTDMSQLVALNFQTGDRAMWLNAGNSVGGAVSCIDACQRDSWTMGTAAMC